MSSPIAITLEIAEPVLLQLVVDNGYVVVPEQVPAAEPLFLASEAARLVTGDKARIDAAVTYSEGERYSSIHAGTVGMISITDDYIYICVKTGTAGNAVWKKSPMFISN